MSPAIVGRLAELLMRGGKNDIQKSNRSPNQHLISAEDISELPTWATAPSANRSEESVEEALVPEQEQIPVPESLVVESAPEVIEDEPKEFVVKGPMSPTVNHRGNTHRKVRIKSTAKNGLLHLNPVEVGEIQTENPLRFEKEGMDLAASRARDVEARVMLPEEVITHRDKLTSQQVRHARSNQVSITIQGQTCVSSAWGKEVVLQLAPTSLKIPPIKFEQGRSRSQ